MPSRRSSWPSRLSEHGLTQVLHNLPAGDWAGGERGIACLPDRVGEFQDGVGQAIEYATRARLPAGQLPGRQGARGRGRRRGAPHLRRQPQVRRTGAEAGRHQAADRAGQHPRHPGLLPEHYGAGDRDHGRGRLGQPLPAVRLLSHADHGGRSRRRPSSGSRTGSPTSRSPTIPGRNEPGTGEINYPFIFGLLDRDGTSGWIGCEYKPKARRRPGSAGSRRTGRSRP